MDVIIVSPSLDPNQNVSGVSSVVSFIIANNTQCNYIHFKQGSKDKETLLMRLLSLLTDFFKWIFLLISHRDSLIHYNFPLTAKAILRDYCFIRVAMLLRMKMVIHIHGGNYLLGEGSHPLIEKMLQSVFSLKCPFVFLSEKERDVMKERFSIQSTYVLPNVVDLSEANSFVRKFVPDAPFTILYMGRISETKGIAYILEALLKLRSQMPFRLIFAGEEEKDGQYIHQFKEQLGDEQFVYAGIVSGSAKTALLKKCDIFLLPSFYEGLPISLLECMSFGLVPVVTNVGSISTCVDDGVEGLFIQIRDADSIVETLLHLNANRHALEELSTNARKRIIRQFSPEEYILNLNQIYSLC